MSENIKNKNQNINNQAIEFAKGVIFKKNENAPEFVIGKLSIKKEEFINFLNSKEGDWVNLEIKKSKVDKFYVSVDNYKKEERLSSPSTSEEPVVENHTDPGDLMF